MQMGMMVQILTPGVKYGKEADLRPQMQRDGLWPRARFTRPIMPHPYTAHRV